MTFEVEARRQLKTSVSGCSTEERLKEEEHTRSKEYTSDVGGVHTGPVLEIALLNIKQILLHLLSGLGLSSHSVTADASVVDQDAQALFPRLNLLDELGDLILACNIKALQWHNLALDVLPICLDDAVQLVTRAASDVHLGAIDSESLGDHQTDTTATSGDQSNTTLQVEETVAVEITMACCRYALSSHCGCLILGERCY